MNVRDRPAAIGSGEVLRQRVGEIGVGRLRVDTRDDVARGHLARNYGIGVIVGDGRVVVDRHREAVGGRIALAVGRREGKGQYDIVLGIGRRMVQGLHQREVVRAAAGAAQRGEIDDARVTRRGRRHPAGVPNQRAVAQDREAHHRPAGHHPGQPGLGHIEGHRPFAIDAVGDVEVHADDRGGFAVKVAAIHVAVTGVAGQSLLVNRGVHRIADARALVGQFNREGRRLGVAVKVLDRVGEGLHLRPTRRHVGRRGVIQVHAVDHNRAAQRPRGNHQ